MKTIFNTSFFFDESIRRPLCDALRTHWLKAATELGSQPPLVLEMDSENGINRIAIQAFFRSPAEATRFNEEIASKILARLSDALGPEKFTAFSTLMQQIEL